MSSTLSTTPTPTTTTKAPVEPFDHRLVVAGVTLGVIGFLAVSIIIYWTFHLKVPRSVPTLSDPEAYPSSKDKSSSPGSSAAKGKGGLVRKATKTLNSFNNHTLHALDALGANARYKKSDYNFSAKITPFGASNDEETLNGHKPKFIHIPGQNMRIATRMPNGAWTFSEPDVRTNRRSTAWSTFGLGNDATGRGSMSGGNVARQRQSTFGIGNGGGNGNGSTCGAGGYRGIDASSVSQVSPTTSSFFSHKPRFMGGPGYGYAGLAADSSLSLNTQGFGGPPSPSLSSADSHSLGHYDLGLGPVTISPETEHENPFDSPLPTPITSDSHTTTSTTRALWRKKEEEASYGFMEREIEHPPPAYTERNRIGSREYV